MKEDKTPEGITTINEHLAETDIIPHPFYDPKFQLVAKAMCRVLSVAEYKPSSTTVDNVIYDPRLAELPVEERKRREAQAAGKPFRVPEWWRGERANYKVAKSMMHTLPKKMGPVKD